MCQFIVSSGMRSIKCLSGSNIYCDIKVIGHELSIGDQEPEQSARLYGVVVMLFGIAIIAQNECVFVLVGELEQILVRRHLGWCNMCGYRRTQGPLNAL